MDASTRSEIQTLVKTAAAKLSTSFFESGSHETSLCEVADLLAQVSALISVVENADLHVVKAETNHACIYPPMTGWEFD